MLKIGSLLCATIAVAMIGITALAPALAQSGPTQAIAADNLFWPATADFKPGADRASIIKRSTPPLKFAQMSGCVDLLNACEAKCTTLYGSMREELLNLRDSAEAKARTYAHALCVVACDRASKDFNNCIRPCEHADREPPNLKVIWTPPSGTKVKPGGKITVKVTARDDANAWQDGVRQIWLEDVSEGIQYVGDPTVYPQPEVVGYCNRRHAVRTFERTYTVPDNPPPLVYLKALAEDFNKNVAFDLGKFPTVDWFGTIKKTAKGGGFNHTVDVDFAFEIETSGTIKGRARGRVVSNEEHQVPGCTILWTFSPSEFEISLSGRRVGENFEIALKPGPITATNRTNCTHVAAQGSDTVTSPDINPAGRGERNFLIPARDGAKNIVDNTYGALPFGMVTRDTIEIHQARQ